MADPVIVLARERLRAAGTPVSLWRREARAVMIVALREAIQADEDPTAALRRVDAAYPFGPREHHPYKMWLEERRTLLMYLELRELSREEQIRADRAAQLALSWKEGPK